MAWTLEETVTTRAGALCLSRPRSRLVSRNGARWLRAKVRSSPSAVTCLVFQYPPALLTSTSIRGRRWSASAASARTPGWQDRSATNTSTCPPPAARISPAALSPRPRSRPVIARCAPIAARPSAVALPMPPVPPVTSTVRPAIGPRWICSMFVLPRWCGYGSRRRDRSGGDGDLASCFAGFEVTHGLGRLVERVGRADAWRHLPCLDEAGEPVEVAGALLGGDHGQPLAQER